MYYNDRYWLESLTTLRVECWAIPATQGVRVTTVTTGTFPDTASFGLEIWNDSASTKQHFVKSRTIGANESVTMPSPAGSFLVGFDRLAIWQRCTVTPSYVQPVRVEANSMASLTFNVDCGP